jgi:hypothetical protein
VASICAQTSFRQDAFTLRGRAGTWMEMFERRLLWGHVSVFASPWVYVAIVALCGLGRELIRSWFRHRDLALLLKKAQDPSSLIYLVRLEEARYPRPAVRRVAETDRVTVCPAQGCEQALSAEVIPDTGSTPG